MCVGQDELLLPRQPRAFRLERPVDEGREAAGFILQIAQAAQVLDALRDRLDVSEHHRATGFHPDLVRGPHDGQPLLGASLTPADLPPHAVDQDLAPAAGNRIQPCRAQPLEHVAQRHPKNPVERPDLRRAEGVHVDAWVVPLDETQQIEIPRERQTLPAVVAGVRHEPALHQDLRPADRQ